MTLAEQTTVAVKPGSPELTALIQQIGEAALDRDRDRRPPFDQYRLLEQARFGAFRIPAEYGGGGASIRQLYETVIELASHDPDLTHALRNHFLSVESRLPSLAVDGLDPILRRVVAGSFFGSSASEPGVANVGEVKSSYDATVVRDGDAWRLNGTKIYSTGNLYADELFVSALGPDGRVAEVLIPADREGVVHEDDWDGIGQRLTGSGTTRYVDVRVTDDEFVPRRPDNYPRPAYTATPAQLWLTAVIAGSLRRITSDAVALIKGRGRSYYHAPTESPVDDPLLQETLGIIAANAYVAEAAVLNAADLLGASTDAVVAGKPDADLSLAAALAAAKTKVVVDKIGQRTAAQLFDVGGASAARQRSQLDRHWRNIRTLASHNPRSYKARWIGDYELRGTPLPDGAYF